MKSLVVLLLFFSRAFAPKSRKTSPTVFRFTAMPVTRFTSSIFPRSMRETIDYKLWTLWSILIAAVALLGLMAYRLSRQVSKSPELADRRENKN